MFVKWILIEKAEDIHGKRFFGSVISESRQRHGMETSYHKLHVVINQCKKLLTRAQSNNYCYCGLGSIIFYTDLLLHVARDNVIHGGVLLSILMQDITTDSYFFCNSAYFKENMQVVTIISHRQPC